MPLIAREKRENFKTVPIRFEESLADRILAYADFLDSSKDHVVSEAMRYIIERDRDFTAHLEANGTVPKRKRGRPSTKHAVGV